MTTLIQLDDFEDWHERQMQDPEFAEELEKIKPEYEAIIAEYEEGK